MLLGLHVKNLALIEEEEISFEDGLNILTGETGAGKSILLGSVNLALGAKADKSLIRTGADFALVELLFRIDNERQREKLKAMDIEPDEDGTVLIKRKIYPGRTQCSVCGETVTTHELRGSPSFGSMFTGRGRTRGSFEGKRSSRCSMSTRGKRPQSFCLR